MTTIRLCEEGNVLGSRASGEEVRRRVATLLRQGRQVTLDFSGVEIASHCFLDEMVGKLFLEFGEGLRGRLRIVNASQETQALIRRVLQCRKEQREQEVKENVIH